MIDPEVPSPARIYDYLLGGKDNYECDRAVADRLIEIDPDVVPIVRENRHFLSSAVRHLVQDVGVRQFLDIGTGLPTQDNVHQVAHRYAPDARIVYVDNDPVVLAHARVFLDSPNATILEGDLRRPGEVLEQARSLLDFGEPVALLLVAVLHFITDDEDPEGNVAVLRDALPPGSRLVLSHGTADGPGSKPTESESAYQRASSQLSLRPRARIERFFDGLEMEPPGLTWVQEWWPRTPVAPEHRRGVYAGIGIRR